MRETSLYCRPDYVLTRWGAGLQPDGLLFVYGTDPKRRLAKRSEAILAVDFDQSLFVDIQGITFYLSPDCTVVTWEGCEDDLRALMAKPRRVRKPENYTHPDDWPELRELLSVKRRPGK